MIYTHYIKLAKDSPLFKVVVDSPASSGNRQPLDVYYDASTTDGVTFTVNRDKGYKKSIFNRELPQAIEVPFNYIKVLHYTHNGADWDLELALVGGVLYGSVHIPAKLQAKTDFYARATPIDKELRVNVLHSRKQDIYNECLQRIHKGLFMTVDYRTLVALTNFF